MRGVVMEIENGRAVLLKNSGLVETVRARPGWQLGDVVAVPGKTLPFKALAGLAAVFVLCAGLLLAGYAVYNTQTTLVSIDVNPSIELSINRFDRVLAAQGLNPEAELLLRGLALRGLPYEEAVALLMGDETLNGYIAENAFVVLSVQTDDAARQESLLAGLQATVDTAVLPHHANASIEYLLADRPLVEAAHGHGMSAGKYLLVQELAEMVPDLNVDAYSHHSVGDIQGEIEAHRNRHGREAMPGAGGQGEGHHTPGGRAGAGQ